MKEFDFEELDRAVNSLISPVAAPADSPAPVNLGVDKNTTPAVDSNPAVPTPPNSTADSPTPTPVTPVPPRSIVERRQSGRFMDVVHPSSDMKTSNNTPTRSREEIKVAPREASTIESTTETASATPTWPDPIDFNETKETPKTAETAPIESDPQITPELTVDETLNSATSNGSPFLPDAKVDKRPLGAFSGEKLDESPQPSIEPVENKEPKQPSGSDDQSLAPAGQDETDTPLPAELQENLLSIESDSTTPTVSDAPNRDEEPVGPTSITQQYTATPSTNIDKPGEIYDTKAYHQALKSPVKKKSSWWLVVWIGLLLVVGAGAGAAIYYFVLPAL